MPKAPIKMLPIDKEKFLSILKQKRLSIHRLALNTNIADKTIRTIIKDGKIQKNFLIKLTEYLHVKPEDLGSPNLEEYYKDDILYLRSKGFSLLKIVEKMKIPSRVIYRVLIEDIEDN